MEILGMVISPRYPTAGGQPFPSHVEGGFQGWIFITT